MERWPKLLPIYLAEHKASVGTPLYTLEEIAKHFDITVQEIEVYSEQIAFRAEVRGVIAEIKDSNSIIRQKAKAQLETYLDNMIPAFMVDTDFPPAEKVKLFKFLQELSETGGSTAEKAKAKLDAVPQNTAPTLNLYLTQASGESVPLSGITIVQEPEPVETVIDSKEEKKDGE
jgi:hypothetical protein